MFTHVIVGRIKIINLLNFTYWSNVAYILQIVIIIIFNFFFNGKIQI